MAGRPPVPIRMIDVENDNEVIDVYENVEDCAYDNNMSADTIRAAIQYNRKTKSGYRFEKVMKLV